VTYGDEKQTGEIRTTDRCRTAGGDSAAGRLVAAGGLSEPVRNDLAWYRRMVLGRIAGITLVFSEGTAKGETVARKRDREELTDDDRRREAAWLALGMTMDEVGKCVPAEAAALAPRMEAACDELEAVTTAKVTNESAKLPLDARACGVLAANPHFVSVAQIARAIGVTHQALNSKKCPKFRAALEVVKQSATPPRGFKSKDGDIDATDEN